MATIATVIFACGIFGLFLLDRDRNSQTSFALWIPVIWVLLAASRSVSQWLATLAGTTLTDQEGKADFYLEGNETDRWVLSILVMVAVVVLIYRRRWLVRILRDNAAIVLFFAYCGLSTLWSDHTDVSFKRFIKAVGDLAMVLVVLTEVDPMAAVKKVVAKAAFLLVPVSVLLIKYYPDLGRGYHPWVWTPYYTGVTTNKNELGFVCLICGLGSLWRLLQAVHDRKRGPLLAYTAVLAMVFWLFWMANSMTSLACFLMASVLMLVLSARRLARTPVVVHFLVAAILTISGATLFLDIGSGMLQTMGRDPTLTGRTDIWKLALSMNSSPLIGTGFESFWLPPRLDKIWSVYWWHPRQAHDGYIDVYLNLGWIGVALLGVVLVTGYKNVISAFRSDLDSGRLRLAYFVAAVAYNFTESAIRMLSPVWIFFILSAVAVPDGWARPARKPAELPVTPEPAELGLAEWA